MKDFVSAVSAFFLKEKNICAGNLTYMEMPDDKGKYNLSKIIGNVNLTEGRYKVESEANAIITNFLSMPLP